MGYTIAVAGKGGTGKSTIAALLVRLLKEAGKGSILAVDADPNSNLAELLGVETGDTIGGILDQVAQHPERIPAGMPKERFIEFQIHKAIQEAEGFDVLTMGKPEGPGCYCYVNNVLRTIMAGLIKDYDYILIDNEAGLEHLSRRTTRSADVLLVVSDETPVALRAAQRINELVKELEIKVKKSVLVVNRSDGRIEKEKTKTVGAAYLGSIPLDAGISRLSLEGVSLFGLPDKSVGLSALRALGEKIWS